MESNKPETSQVTSEQAETLENFAEKQRIHEQFSEVMANVPYMVQRGGIYLIIGILVILLLILYFFKIHVVVTAKGQIVPENEGILVQSIESGVVVQVMAKVGDRLPKGAPLIRIDRPESRLTLAALKRKVELQGNQLKDIQESERLVQSILEKPQRTIPESKLSPLPPNMMMMVNSISKSRLELEKVTFMKDEQFVIKEKQILNEIGLLEKKIEVLKKNQKTSEDYLVEEDNQLKLKEKHLKDFEKLASQGFYSEIDLERERERLRQAYVQRDSNQKRLDQLILQISNEGLRLSEISLQLEAQKQEYETRYAQIQLTHEQNISNLKHGLDLMQREQKAIAAAYDNSKDEMQLLEQRMQYTTIEMPVTGTIIQFHVTNTGALVGAGQVVAVVMKDGERLIIKATVPNQDIGFVQRGLDARIKVEAYPFQQFGTVPGRVKTLYPNIGSNKDFSIIIALLETHIGIDDGEIALFPGLAVEVDLLTRKERIINLLLSGSDDAQKEQHQMQKRLR